MTRLSLGRLCPFPPGRLGKSICFDDIKSKLRELLFQIGSAEAEKMVAFNPGEVILVYGVGAGEF
jgi:hypothetical protein